MDSVEGGSYSEVESAIVALGVLVFSFFVEEAAGVWFVEGVLVVFPRPSVA